MMNKPLKRKQEENIIFPSAELLYNHTPSTFITLQVARKAFRGVSCNSATNRKITEEEGALTTSSISQDISRTDPFQHPCGAASRGASGQLHLPTRMCNYIH